MSNAVRRRLAAGGGLLSAALVAGLVATLPAGAAVTATESAFNDRTETVTFVTQERVPPGSSLRFDRLGGTAEESFSAPVNGNDGSLMRPTVTVDFRNPRASQVPANAGDGPANPGAYNVTVVTAGTSGESCSGCFRVLSPSVPAITSVAPTGTPRGTAVEVTLRGRSFARDTALSVVLPDRAAVPADQQITVSRPSGSGPSVTNDTLRRVITVPGGAALGPRSLVLVNTDGEQAVCERCFNVLGAAITGVTPNEARNTADDAAVPVTFTAPADTFGPDATVTLVHVGSSTGSSDQQRLSVPGTVTSRRASATAPENGSSLTATFDLRLAAPGREAYLPTVTSSSGGTNVGPRFSVTQPNAVTVSGAAPTTQQAGTAQRVTVSGTGFARGATVAFERPAGNPTETASSVQGTDVEVLSSTTLRATLTLATGAPVGTRNIRVTNTDGQTGVCTSTSTTPCFTVTAAPSPSPSASASVSPSASATATVSPSPSRSATPTASASPSPSATPTASSSPSPDLQRPTLDLSPTTIVAVQERATVSGTAEPGSRLELVAYSRPSTKFVTVRDITVGPDGRYSFVVGPSGSTRLFVRSSRDGQTASSRQAVLQVRTSINLKVARTGPKTYRFTGSTLPKRRGQLVTVFYQADGAQRVIASRARVGSDGRYDVTRRFGGSGTFTLFTGTGTDVDNLGNESNRVRTTLR